MQFIHHIVILLFIIAHGGHKESRSKSNSAVLSVLCEKFFIFYKDNIFRFICNDPLSIFL